jgi:hypothetical protein
MQRPRHPSKRTPSTLLSAADEDLACWPPLEEVLKDVVLIVSEGKSSAQSLLKLAVECYDKIYAAVGGDQRTRENIHRRLKRWTKSYLTDWLTCRLKACVQQSNKETLFKSIAKPLADFKNIKRFGRKAFSYLDVYVTKRSDFDRIEQLYAKAFDRVVGEEVTRASIHFVLQQVTARRDGKQVDMQAVQSAKEVFTIHVDSAASNPTKATEIYEAECESRYLRDLANAYEALVTLELNRDGGHHFYLQWVQSRYDLEKALATEFLQPSSLPKVMDSLEKRCLGDQISTVILHPESGFATLLMDSKETELHRMFMLFSRIKEAVQQKEAVKLMTGELKKHLILEGEAAMKSLCGAACSDGGTNIALLLQNAAGLFDRYKKCISSHLENHIEMLEALKKGFETFMDGKLGQPDNTDPEVLASYTDCVLRRTLKDVVDPEAEDERLEHIAIVVTFLKEKDVYQELCKAKLAKRLLQTTPNLDLERSFLEKLQPSMGPSFTYNMKGMMDDQVNTKTVDEAFQQDESAKHLTTEFQCQVLTAGHWPAYKSDSLEPPESLRQCMNAFAVFYKKKYPTRALRWLHTLGSSTLLISFPKGPKDVTCSRYQASILCLVDGFGTVSAKDIAQNMKLDLEKAVKPNIASMYISKQFPLLISVDATGAEKTIENTIADEDRFSLNPAFQFKLRKFRLLPPSSVASSDMPTNTDMDAKRKAMMDACIVRVMKSRKELSSTGLLDLCVTQLSKSFRPQPKDITKRIEDLIGRGYLRRQPEDPARFEYLA